MKKKKIRLAHVQILFASAWFFAKFPLPQIRIPTKTNAPLAKIRHKQNLQK